MEHYWIGFSRVKGIGGARIQFLINHFGDLERAWLVSEKELLDAGLHSKLIESILSTRGSLDLEDELKRLTEAGFSVVTTEHPGYPRRLREIDPPPPVLYQWGEITEADHWAVLSLTIHRVVP